MTSEKLSILSRAELYQRLWSTPIPILAKEFRLGRGLNKGLREE